MSRATVPLELLQVHAIADEAEEIVRKAALNSFGRQFLKPLDREDDIDIDVGVVVRVLQLMDDQVLMAQLRGHAAEPEITK